MESFLLLPWSWRLQDFIIRFHFAVILIQFGNYFKISFDERRIIRGAEIFEDIRYLLFSKLRILLVQGVPSIACDSIMSTVKPVLMATVFRDHLY